jgi:hypothetical protein
VEDIENKKIILEDNLFKETFIDLDYDKIIKKLNI